MKQIVRTSLALLCLLMAVHTQAQQREPTGGEVVFNPSNTACLTAEDHERYHLQVAENKAILDAQGRRAFHPYKASQQVFFDWPVRQADDLDLRSA